MGGFQPGPPDLVGTSQIGSAAKFGAAKSEYRSNPSQVCQVLRDPSTDQCLGRPWPIPYYNHSPPKLAQPILAEVGLISVEVAEVWSTPSEIWPNEVEINPSWPNAGHTWPMSVDLAPRLFKIPTTKRWLGLFPAGDRAPNENLRKSTGDQTLAPIWRPHHMP